MAARDLADEQLVLKGSSRIGRFADALRIAWFAFQRRATIDAIHANATTGLFLSALAARVSATRLVVWVHDPVTAPTGNRVGSLVRRLVGDVHYAAVTDVAAGVAVAYGLADRNEIALIPNPIAPEEVVGDRRSEQSAVVVGYLGSASHRKGFDVLADVAEMVAGPELHFRLFTFDRRDDTTREWWEKIDRVQAAGHLDVPGVSNDVREVYAQCDVVFNPSRDESFCRVAAEAMVNGLPVVAGDIPALRALLGENEAGLLYPVEDRSAAADALVSLATQPDLRRRLGAEGRRRAGEFEPEKITEDLMALYGLRSRTSA